MFPVDLLFAWMVEVKLDELVEIGPDAEAAARFVVDLHSMAVVDDAERRRAVVEFQLGRIAVVNCSRSNIDRRLRRSRTAKAIFGVEPCPMGGAIGSRIGPVVRAAMHCKIRQRDGE